MSGLIIPDKVIGFVFWLYRSVESARQPYSLCPTQLRFTMSSPS